MAKVRIAIELTTGRKYIIDSVDLRRNEIWVWGEVVSSNGTNTKHERMFTIPRNEAKTAEVEKSLEFCRELFDQGLARLESEGKIEIYSDRTSARGRRTVRYRETK